MATRKVPVTSVTPASKVKATSNAQQSRTRNLVMGIAAATPVGRAAKAGATAAKAVSSATKAKKVVKPLTEPKSAVKVKPAAKNKPNQPSAIKLMMKEIRSEKQSTRIDGESRKASIQIKNLPKRSNAATQPSNWGSGAERVKINSGVKSQTADQARSSNAAKKPAPANTPSRTPANPARSTVIVNSAKTVRRLKVGPKKK